MGIKEGDKSFKTSLLSWFTENRRDLPWRRSYEAYQIWISEIMLQQTQMERGVEYFNRWLTRFPDVSSLAAAPEQEVLKAWEGLGYYSRARNILKTAGVLLAEHGGRIPDDYRSLLDLPGIGPYTAAAIMSIAFNRPYPLIDANVERVFARLEDIDRPVREKAVRDQLEKRLNHLLAETEPREFNQALMEMGALLCRPRTPLCRECPIQKHCRALQAGTVTMRPVLPPKKNTTAIVMSCIIIRHGDKYLIQQRHNDDVWGGLWEFPGGRLKDGESPARAARRELYEETEIKAGRLQSFATVTHSYSRYRVTLHSFFWETGRKIVPRLHAARKHRWVTLEELDRFAFPSGHRQLIARMKTRSSERE